MSNELTVKYVVTTAHDFPRLLQATKFAMTLPCESKVIRYENSKPDPSFRPITFIKIDGETQ